MSKAQPVKEESSEHAQEVEPQVNDDEGSFDPKKPFVDPFAQKPAKKQQVDDEESFETNNSKKNQKTT